MRLPTYDDMRAVSQAAAASVVDTQCEAAISNGILDAAIAGNYTATVNWTANSSISARENITNRLRQAGYRVAPAASNVVIDWSRLLADPIA